MKLGGAVLCGGRSSRMGRPKALLRWEGGTLVEHAVATLRRVVDSVVVVASADLAVPEMADVRVVRDRDPNLGPLGGIREALEASEADLIFVTSTDAPFLTTAFVERVLSFGTAAAPRVDGWVQTLSAAYPKALAAEASRLIAEERMRPLFLLEAGSFRPIEPDELPDLDSLRNLNTPDDYLEAVRGTGSVSVELMGLAYRAAGRSELDPVPPGRLGDVLAHVQRSVPTLELLEGDELAASFLVSLDGHAFLREPSIPIGPGDRLVILDAATGG